MKPPKDYSQETAKNSAPMLDEPEFLNIDVDSYIEIDASGASFLHVKNYSDKTVVIKRIGHYSGSIQLGYMSKKPWHKNILAKIKALINIVRTLVKFRTSSKPLNK